MIKFRDIARFTLLVAFVLALLTTTGSGSATMYSYKIVHRYPHDPTAFTQGLVFHDGFLYEGTGLYGESSLRKVNFEDGTVLEYVGLGREFFGEGIAILGNKLFQLTWLEGRGFVYDLPTLAKIDEFSYQSEGWGLTTDGEYLIISDGSDVLTYLDPESYEPMRQVSVSGENGPVKCLNELEYINGEIYANIWLTDWVIRISPLTGKVLGWIDLSGLRVLEKSKNSTADVLNGIACDQENDRLFVTGKLWSSVYEIQLVR